MMKLIDVFKGKLIEYIKKVHVAITFDDGKFYIRTKIIGKNGITTEDKVYDQVGEKMPDYDQVSQRDTKTLFVCVYEYAPFDDQCRIHPRMRRPRLSKHAY